jgi:hypothetical protein
MMGLFNFCMQRYSIARQEREEEAMRSWGSGHGYFSLLLEKPPGKH